MGKERMECVERCRSDVGSELREIGGWMMVDLMCRPKSRMK